MANEPKKIIPANVILEKIQNGDPVECYDVVIEGDLDLSTLDLQTQRFARTNDEIVIGLLEIVKVVSSSIKIADSEIRGKIKFDNCILQKMMIFSGAQFGGYADFNGALFNGEFADFSGAQFRADANFEGTKSKNDIRFGNEHNKTKFEPISKPHLNTLLQ